MADQYTLRSFPDNPAPIPSDVLKTMANPPAPAFPTPQDEVAARPEVGVVHPSKNDFAIPANNLEEEGDFWASGPDKSGRRKLFYTNRDGDTEGFGDMSADRAKILAIAAEFNEGDGSYRRIPKPVFESLQKQELGILSHVHKMYDAGKAGTAEGMIWWQNMSGKMEESEALDKSDLELLKMQVDSPLTPWRDGRLASMASAFPWVFGKVAQALPSLQAGMTAGMEQLPAMALGATVLAATGGPAGLAALATPAGFGAVLGASASAGMFDFTFKVTTGSIYGDMRRKGVDPALAKRIAPMAGIIAGSLEIVGFKYFTAAAKRTFLKEVLGNESVKAQMSKWYLNYLKETGAEAGVETAQQLVEEYTKNMILLADNRPELMRSQADIAKASAQAGVDAFFGFGALKAPMAMIEGVSAKSPSAKKAGGATASPATVEGVAPTISAAKMNETLAAAPETPVTPAAPSIEQELIKDSPEVAAALSELNSELDPTAEDAEAAYSFIGEELAGDENADAAVTVKVEALRAEMSDILAEEDNTPSEQRRVVEIQREIGLLDEMQKKMAAGPTVSEEAAPAEGGMVTAPKKPITGAKARVKKQIIAARDAKLTSDINNNLAMVKELGAARTRLEKAGRPVASINQQIAKLMGEVHKLDEARNTLAETGEVGRGEKLELKPATLESITSAAFKEGRAEVTKKRAEQVKDVAEQNSLTDADIRTLIKTRNLGVMTDFEFKTFLDDLRGKAKVLAEKKQARAELHTVQSEKDLKREANIRKFHGLPPVAKMTAAQMGQYAEILEGFETGDTFWTSARIKALQNTRFKGATTLREVLEMAVTQLGVPLEELSAATAGQFDALRSDNRFAAKNPLYAFVVQETQKVLAENAIETAAIIAEHHKLAKAAIESRGGEKKGVWSRLVDWLAPTQENIMAYIEATDPKQKAALGAALTKEELALADFYTAFYKDAEEYLLANGDIESTRFTGGKYAPHYARTIPEIFKGVAKTGEIGKALSEIWESFKESSDRIQLLDKNTGRALSLRKSFAQTKFRSGEMTPSTDMIRAFDLYSAQFGRKKALDEIAPSIETLAMALAANEKTPEAQENAEAVLDSIRTYVNSKKGIQPSQGKWAPTGGAIDTGVRLATAWASIKLIALNVPLQATMFVGEKSAVYMVLGGRAIAKANYRKITKQGKAILAKYKGVIGEGVVEKFSTPGANITARLGLLFYGMAHQSRVSTMKDLILGSMTDAEFAAGEISPERIAAIKIEANRWIDIEGLGSAAGATSIGKMLTQFKRWAIPMAASALDLATSLSKSLAGKKELTTKDKVEMGRLLKLSLFAAATAYLIDLDDEEKKGRNLTALQKVRRNAVREILSPLQGFNLKMFTVLPVAATVASKLAADLATLLAIWDLEASGKAAKRIPMHLPNFVRNAFWDKEPADRKKAGPPRPVKFKRNRD
jgi:hypothetical protein